MILLARINFNFLQKIKFENQKNMRNIAIPFLGVILLKTSNFYYLIY